MDRAILRPGRFGKLLYIPLPSADERVLILQALARKKPVDASVNLNDLARRDACENLSGADLAALVCPCFTFCCLFNPFISSACLFVCVHKRHKCLILRGYGGRIVRRMGRKFGGFADFLDYTDERSSNRCC